MHRPVRFRCVIAGQCECVLADQPLTDSAQSESFVEIVDAWQATTTTTTMTSMITWPSQRRLRRWVYLQLSSLCSAAWLRTAIEWRGRSLRMRVACVWRWAGTSMSGGVETDGDGRGTRDQPAVNSRCGAAYDGRFINAVALASTRQRRPTSGATSTTNTSNISRARHVTRATTAHAQHASCGGRRCVVTDRRRRTEEACLERVTLRLGGVSDNAVGTPRTSSSRRPTWRTWRLRRSLGDVCCRPCHCQNVSCRHRRYIRISNITCNSIISWRRKMSLYMRICRSTITTPTQCDKRNLRLVLVLLFSFLNNKASEAVTIRGYVLWVLYARCCHLLRFFHIMHTNVHRKIRKYI